MSIHEDLIAMAGQLASRFKIPRVSRWFLPAYHQGGQPKDAEFMALLLEGGAAGVSYVMLPPEAEPAYNALREDGLDGEDPVALALAFGAGDPLRNMLSLAALNALCHHVIRTTAFPLDFETDSLGLLAPARGDRVGMVGLFPPLLDRIREQGAELVVVELDEKYVTAYPGVHVTLDTGALRDCNKVLCTSTTVINNTLDGVLACCAPEATVSMIGPTIGYFPDALFARGISVVGGTFIHDGERFLQLLSQRERWKLAAQKFCFRRSNYSGVPS